MIYTVCFNSPALDRDVFDNARGNNQLITFVAVEDGGTLEVEFESSRDFEKDNFLNSIQAQKDTIFRDYYHAWKYND